MADRNEKRTIYEHYLNTFTRPEIHSLLPIMRKLPIILVFLVFFTLLPWIYITWSV